tara:strand:+ start:185 stop:355 length:171 start_codon:yes stop_codon:yes gene_type:complete
MSEENKESKNMSVVEKAIQQWAQTLSREDAKRLSESLERSRKNIEKAMKDVGDKNA